MSDDYLAELDRGCPHGRHATTCNDCFREYDAADILEETDK